MSGREKFAVFTIDVETFSDTGCLYEAGIRVAEDMLDGLDEYIRILERYGIKATMFTVCEAAQIARDAIADYIRRGHKLAVHGLDHTAPLDMNDEQFWRQTKEAKAQLEEMFGVNVRGFRAPFFSLDNRKLEILRSLGFQYDASRTEFGGARHGGRMDMSDFAQLLAGMFRQNGFYECGISCQKMFGQMMPISGGGYTRLMNWMFLKPVIRKYLAMSDYYVFYLHPFELSRQTAPHIKGLKSYDRYYLTRGLSVFSDRIVSIIEMLKEEGYRFVTFEELVDIMESRRVGAR